MGCWSNKNATCTAVESEDKTLQAGKLVILLIPGVLSVKTVACCNLEGRPVTVLQLQGNCLGKLITLLCVCWYLLLLQKLHDKDVLTWELASLQRQKEESFAKRGSACGPQSGALGGWKSQSPCILTSGTKTITQSYWAIEICLRKLSSSSSLRFQQAVIGQAYDIFGNKIQSKT